MCFARCSLLELAGDLDALRLAARERRRRLAKRQVAEPEARSGPRACGQSPVRSAKKAAPSSIDMFRTSSMVLPRSVTSSVSPLKRAPLQVAARHLDVGHEVELRRDHAFALALLAAAALDVEAEPSGLVAALDRQRRVGEQVADGVVEADVGGRVRSAVPADRRLVDVDHLVDVLDTVDRDRGRPAACACPRAPSTTPCTGCR